MTINALTVENFKGIAESQSFEIKPITLFVGPNSSGKSSCLHALACLGQTLKLASSARPLVLDDEYAQVHLGRFIEVIHSKSYQDNITLGVEVDTGIIISRVRRAIRPPRRKAKFTWCFKSTLRTQDISLEEMTIELDDRVIRARRQKHNYLIQDSTHKNPIKAIRSDAFFLEPDYFAKGTDESTQSTIALLARCQRAVRTQIRNVAYLGPFRQPPKRPYPTRGTAPIEVGSTGEAAVPMLANEFVQSKRRTHLLQISKWLGVLGLAKTLDLSRVGRSDQFYVNVTLQDDVTLPIADLGYGVSQVLPVLVQCSFAEAGATLLFEQPELHLHQGAARMLAKVFVQTVVERKAHIVIETHSRELFYQFCQEIRGGSLPLDEFSAYDVVRRDGRSVFTPITLELEDGELEVSHAWGKALDDPIAH